MIKLQSAVACPDNARHTSCFVKTVAPHRQPSSKVASSYRKRLIFPVNRPGKRLLIKLAVVVIEKVHKEISNEAVTLKDYEKSVTITSRETFDCTTFFYQASPS